MDVGFQYNLICDLSPLFAGMILSTNLLTDGRLERYNVKFQCFLK